MPENTQNEMKERRSKSRKYRPETEQKRREIIAAASEVFGEKGFNDGTLEEIADRTGLTRAGVLHHFGSKRALLMEVVKNRDASGGKQREQMHIDHGVDWFRHLAATADDNAKHPGMVRLFTMVSGESVVEKNDSMSYFRDRYRDLRNDLMASFVQMAKERKSTINMAEAEMASSAVIAVMDGLQYQWLLQQGKSDGESVSSEDADSVDLAEYTRYAINVLVAAVLEHHDDPPLIQ